ncbi:MAG: alcohol dehydrogenase catalytic domain-containing protein, partial [Ignisphaera sp.]
NVIYRNCIIQCLKVCKYTGEKGRNMPIKGRAAVFREARKPLSIEEIEFPDPKYDEVLIKVRAVGVCHTDLATIDGEFPPPPLMPTVLGHEIAGEVHLVGEGVREVGPGDGVVLSWLWYTCGKCRFCIRGNEQLCEHLVETGRHVYGGYAEYVLAKASHVIKIPSNVPWEYAPAATDAIATPFKGLRVAGAKEGDVVVVWGVGALGFNAIQVAKAKGCTVIAVGRSEFKLQKAKEVGADVVINASREDPVDAIKRVSDGGADVILQLVPTDVKTYEQAFYSLRRGGVLVLLGYPPGKLCLPVIEWGLDEKKVIASLAFTRYDITESLRLMAQGKVRPVVTTYKGLESINRALDDLREGKVLGRPVVLM